MELNEKYHLLLYSFHFQMTPKHKNSSTKTEKQIIFSCKHENTRKSMEFSKGGE